MSLRPSTAHATALLSAVRRTRRCPPPPQEGWRFRGGSTELLWFALDAGISESRETCGCRGLTTPTVNRAHLSRQDGTPCRRGQSACIGTRTQHRFPTCRPTRLSMGTLAWHRSSQQCQKRRLSNNRTTPRCLFWQHTMVRPGSFLSRALRTIVVFRSEKDLLGLR